MVGIETQSPIITLTAVCLSSIVTFLFTRKKDKAQTTSIDLTNVSKTILIYEKASEELRKEADELKSKYQLLLCEVSELSRRVTAMQKENQALKTQINRQNNCKKKTPRK